MPRSASIDIGTQTIRILVADFDGSGNLIPVYRDRSIVRLGEGMTERKYLNHNSTERALTCIKSFINNAIKFKAEKIYAVATACVREALNGKDFIEKVYRETGVAIRLLTGEEEARLSLLGVQSVFHDKHGQSLVIDIGGGSTELILTNNGIVELTESLPLGVVHLSEKYFYNDPPSPQELSGLNNNIKYVLTSNCNCYAIIKYNRINNLHLIGTAGTATTLAAMDLKLTEYNIARVNGHLLTRIKLDNLYNKMILIPSNIRLNLPGLEPGREIVIIAGTIIILTVMELFGLREMSVSDSGLLEGILLEAIGVNT